MIALWKTRNNERHGWDQESHNSARREVLHKEFGGNLSTKTRIPQVLNHSRRLAVAITHVLLFFFGQNMEKGLVPSPVSELFEILVHNVSHLHRVHYELTELMHFWLGRADGISQ
jgi:hypothetical protein